MNTYLLVSSLLNFFSAILLISFIVSLGERSAAGRRYLTFLGAIAFWSLFYFFWRFSEDASTAFLFSELLIAVAGFIPITFFHFTCLLVERRFKPWVIAGYVMALLFSVMVPTGLIVDGVVERHGHAHWPNAGSMMWLFLIYFSGYGAASLWLLWRGAQTSIGARSSSRLFVFYSYIIGNIGGFTNFPLWYDIPIQPYGNGLVAIYIFLVGYGFYGSRAAAISANFYKAFAGLMLNSSAAITYLIGLALYAYWSGLEIDPYTFWIHGIVFFGISAIAFWSIPKMKFWTERTFDSFFKKDDADRLGALKRLPETLFEYSNENKMFESACSVIQQTLDLQWVAVLRRETFESQYGLICSSGEPIESLRSEVFEGTDPLCEYLARHPAVFILDAVDERLDENVYKALVALNMRHGLAAVVPVSHGAELYGLILLGKPVSRQRLTEEEASLLFATGSQIGLNIRTRELERKSSEVEKLVALGTMSAGLAHELRNPLVSVNTFASMVTNPRGSQRIPDEFKEVLTRDVQRISNIVEGVSMFSQNKRVRLDPMVVEEAIRMSIDIHRERAQEAGIEFRFDADRETIVLGNEGQLVQVFNNLIENAIHAQEAQGSGFIEIQVRQRTIVGVRKWVEISVEDGGPGIAAGIRRRIFDPFITSKDTGVRADKGGMGLGLAISKRIIENHEGAIGVKENHSGGACFALSLKCPEDELHGQPK